jgi:hypothetical protein
VNGKLHISELIRCVADVSQCILCTSLLIEVDSILPKDLSLLGVHFIAEVHKEIFKVINRSAFGDISNV